MSQDKTRKPRLSFTPEQKLEYAKLMVVEGYNTRQVMDISGAGATAVARWKKQYEQELKGHTPEGKKAFTEDQKRIQDLEKQLWRAKRDNEILKKATALLAQDNNELS
ncbi:Mobile element protein [hydrothermal vent metagenome]|uniref:Mobile element protein n=1 Tax=hydrothermal vent metagenome TaxID=652676 RepID=A0A3B1AKM0_9ZZZZ